MDIAAFKTGWATLMGTMFVIDPVTGLPTTQNIRANAQAPMSLADTDLPTWIFFTGPATYPALPDQTTDLLTHEMRDFTASLFVAFAQAGIDGEAERKVQPYVDSARNLMQSHVRLYNTSADEVPGIQRAWILRDTGISKLRYGSPAPSIYIGISYTVRVTALNKVIYANQ